MTNQNKAPTCSARDISSGCSVSLLVPTGVRKSLPDDLSLLNLQDGAMRARVERAGNISLCLRLEALDESDWVSFARTPGVVSVLDTPLIAWFVVEIFGKRYKAPFVLSLGPDTPFDPRRILGVPGAHRTITLLGISGTTVRSTHVAIRHSRIWEMLEDAVRLGNDQTSESDCYEAARRGFALSADATFAAAMRRHLRPLGP